MIILYLSIGDLFMTPSLICINQHAAVHEAKLLMKEKRIRHLPVINHENKIVGIFTERDLIGTDRFQGLPVELFASPHIEFVTNDTPLRAVALKMLEKKISCVLLTNETSEVSGILTTDDLIYQLSEMLLEKNKSTSLTDEIKNISWIETVGELSRKLADIGI
jgi:CBS domain-containing protein